jgi:zinc protease
MCVKETLNKYHILTIRHSGESRNPVEKIIYWMPVFTGMTGKTQLQTFLKRCVLILLLCFMRAATAAPDIQHWVTDKGVRVYFVETHEIPMVTAKILFDAGSSRDEGKPGVAVLTGALLGEGAGGLSADQISRNFADLGANFGSGAGRDNASVSLQSLSDPGQLDKAAENLRRVISRPDFPPAAFERERSRTLTGIRQKQQSPGDLAGDAFYTAVYGDHPYAHPPEGTEQSVKALTRKDVKDFYRHYYTAKNTVVALVGDLDRTRAEQFVTALFSELPEGARAPALPDVPALKEAKTIKIEHPSTQTHILVGQPGIRRDDPELFPLYVGNNVLGGGGMTSRLFEEIREKRGLSYSTYSYFMPMQQAGPFIAGLQTRNGQTQEALQLLDQQLQEFVHNGPTEDELKATQKYLTGGFPLRIDSNKDIVEYLSMIGFYGLPLDYLDKYTQKIMDVTAKQIQDAFQKKLSPDRMVTVLVGASSPEQEKPN